MLPWVFNDIFMGFYNIVVHSVFSNYRAYFASEREPLKLKTAKRFLQMLCFVILIFLSKMYGQMQSKVDN